MRISTMSLYEPSYRKQRNLRALGWQGQLEQAYYPTTCFPSPVISWRN